MRIYDNNGTCLLEVASFDLEGAHLERASLARAYLAGAHLEGAHLEGAHLAGAHLAGASLDGAHLEYAHLAGAHLECAHLAGAHLADADLDGAHLDGAHLEGACLRGTRMPSPEEPGSFADAAERVAAWLQAGHWVQGSWIETPTGAYAGDCKACLHGAAVYLGGAYGPALSDYLIKEGYTVRWNDEQGRTLAEVCEALRDVQKDKEGIT